MTKTQTLKALLLFYASGLDEPLVACDIDPHDISFISILVAGTAICAGYRAFFIKPYKDGIQPYGRLVEVEGRLLHIRSMGDGPDTVVLLLGILIERATGMRVADYFQRRIW